jgi:AcrR family transcriptional regulator
MKWTLAKIAHIHILLPKYQKSIPQSMKAQKKRHSRDDWLALALDVLAEEGRAKIKIEYLAKRLGVTKGSFYAHFADRRDFVASVAFYWSDTLTATVLDNLSKTEEIGEEKLLLLMQAIKDHELEKYDIVMRAWALDEPLVAEQVEKVDKARFEYIKSVFAEMGFTGDELEVRSMIFQVYHSMSIAMQGSFFERNRFKHEKLRHRFFTRK